MKTKNQIIALIQHDLKNHQNLAVQTAQKQLDKGNNIELLDLVFELMKVPRSAEIDWGKTYCNYINFASYYSVKSSTKDLRNQAENCFSHLQCIIDVETENRVQH